MRQSKVETLVKDGQMAVAVSPGYGAGWSTWNYEELAYDKRVIELILAYQDRRISEEDLGNQLETLGYHNVYLGGLYQVQIMWVPLGTIFRIDEYDGLESVEMEDEIGLIQAKEEI